MRRERSAGVIVYRPTQPQRAYLLLDYGRYWDFAKGHLERGESDHDAALRELEEETGITDIRLLDGWGREIEYSFRSRGGKLVHKTVAFFLGETQTTDIRLSDEHVGGEFVPYDEAVARVTYANARELLEQAEQFLLARPSTASTTT